MIIGTHLHDFARFSGVYRRPEALAVVYRLFQAKCFGRRSKPSLHLEGAWEQALSRCTTIELETMRLSDGTLRDLGGFSFPHVRRRT